jgi:hypothetical protein
LFVEVVFENGNSSVMSVESEAEAISAMAEQHRRAKSGELAGPAGGPAERIVQGFVYDRHPSDYNPADTLSADELNTLVPNLIEGLKDENGVVSVGALSQGVRGLSHPMNDDRGPHESIFKMEHESVITSADIEGGEEV